MKKIKRKQFKEMYIKEKKSSKYFLNYKDCTYFKSELLLELISLMVSSSKTQIAWELRSPSTPWLIIVDRLYRIIPYKSLWDGIAVFWACAVFIRFSDYIRERDSFFEILSRYARGNSLRLA